MNTNWIDTLFEQGGYCQDPPENPRWGEWMEREVLPVLPVRLPIPPVHPSYPWPEQVMNFVGWATTVHRRQEGRSYFAAQGPDRAPVFLWYDCHQEESILLAAAMASLYNHAGWGIHHCNLRMPANHVGDPFHGIQGEEMRELAMVDVLWTEFDHGLPAWPSPIPSHVRVQSNPSKQGWHYYWYMKPASASDKGFAQRVRVGLSAMMGGDPQTAFNSHIRSPYSLHSKPEHGFWCLFPAYNYSLDLPALYDWEEFASYASRPVGEKVEPFRRGEKIRNDEAISIQDILLQLDNVRAAPGGEWRASCPCSVHKHGDRSAGMRIKEVDGRILLHCYAGCKSAAIAQALKIGMHQLFIETEQATTESYFQNWRGQ